MSARSVYLGTDFETLLNEAVAEEYSYESSRKRDYIKKIGECLIYAGYPKTTLGVEIAERIEARYFEKHGYSISVRNSHYYRTVRDLGWNKNFVEKKIPAKPPAEKFAPEEKVKYNPPPETGVQNGSQPNTSEYTKKADCVLENKRLIDTLGDVCGMADVFRDYMRHNEFLSKVDPALTDEITARLVAWVINMRDTMNNKQIIPINTQVMPLQLFNMSSDINNLFGLYFDEIKRIHMLERTKTKKTNQILTSKELIKYQRREIKNLNDILEFHDANEARMSGYYGQQCTLCMGYRTQLAEGNNNKVVCMKCKGRDETGMKREIFYTCMQCRFFVEKPEEGKCPHCGFEYVYPANL